MKKESRRRRGRRSIDANLQYVARIVVDYKIDSSEFFNSIRQAWNQGSSECHELVIRCRNKTKDSGRFLLTTKEKVLGQFPLSIDILNRKGEFEDYVRTIHPSSVKSPEGVNGKIEHLKPGMKHVNLKAKVLEIPKPKMVYTKWGTEAYISNALIGDETGTIRISLWNQQIDKVSEGDVIKIENFKVSSYRGAPQLRMARSGKISVLRSQR